MTDTPQTPAGWYPDPQYPGQQRYWDGTQWTQTAAPLAAMPYARTAPPPKKGGAKKVLIPVLACVALAIVAVTIAAVASGGDDEPGVTADSQTTTDSDDQSDDATSTTDAEGTTTTAAEAKPVAVTGFTKYEALGETWVSVGIVLTGLSGGSQELTISLLDEAGTPIATNTEYVGSDRDGDEVLVASSFTDDTPTAANVRVDITNASSFTDATPFPLTVASQEFDGNFWTVKGTATNEGSENIELGTITCVAFKAGKPVAGVTTYTDTVVPDAQIAFEATGTFDPQADEARCHGEAS